MRSPCGTELIRHTGRTISRNTRKSDIAACYGGDEIIIMFTESSKKEAGMAVRRILADVDGVKLQIPGDHPQATQMMAMICKQSWGEQTRR